VQRWGSDHEGSDLGCIGIRLAAIFGYVVGYLEVYLLEKVWSIWWLDHRERR
jgi:hypothetical protein